MATKIIEKCPICGFEIKRFRNPLPTVDIIIQVPVVGGKTGIILIQRKNYPYGWAIPGGFVDYGESVEEAALRETEEETSMKVELVRLLGVYSDPSRDPRGHTISTVFVAKGRGTPKARDDAKGIGIFTQEQIPEQLAFDHAQILRDYFEANP